MKRLILILSIILGFVHLSTDLRAQWATYQPIPIYQSSIDNGWYEAIVVYTNYSTNHKAKYKLTVKVEYNRVTEIKFGNEGSVHSGINYSNYYYSGGYLSFSHNNNGQIIAASASVDVNYSTGNFNRTNFKIYIE